MSVEHTPTEGQMFAPTPVWDRRGKRKSGLRRAAPAKAAGETRTPAPEPRSYDPTPRAGVAASGYVAPEPRPLTETRAADTETLSPVRDRPVRKPAARKGLGMAPLAIGAGVVALAGLAAAGWYASQPRETSVAELTPGESGSAATPAQLTGQTDGAAAPMRMAANETTPPVAAPAQAPARSTAAAPRTAAPARARPAPAAPAMSAEDNGVAASATLPTGPTPYSELYGADASTSAVSGETSGSPSIAAPEPLQVPAPTTGLTEPAPMPSTPPAAAPSSVEPAGEPTDPTTLP